MKKILIILLAVIAVAVLTTPACAAESGLKVSDVTVQEEETIYVPVSFRTEVTGTAIALEYTYDSKLLEILPEECRWIQKGTLSDFSKTGPQAVWASSGAKKLSGDLCVLAFRIVNMQSFTDTEIGCSITVKNGSETVGVYQDAAGITKVCSHQFGDWTDSGSSGHTRSCSLCRKEELQSHNWDTGTETTDSAKPNVTVIAYHCADCGAEKTVEVPGDHQEVRPTDPEATRPSDSIQQYPEETRPQPFYPPEYEKTPSDTQPAKPSHQESYQPSGNNSTSGQNQSINAAGQPRDYNEQVKNNTQDPTANGSEPIQPNGSSPAGNEYPANTAGEQGPVKETYPMAIKVENPAEAPAEDPDAEKTAGAETNAGSIGVIIGMAVTICAAALWIFVIRRKKR